MRKCSRHGCVEGEFSTEFNTTTTFESRKKNGLPYAACDQCRDRNNRDWWNRVNEVSKSSYNTISNNCVYGMVDRVTDTLIYIGSSKNTPYRLYQHFDAKGGNTAHKFMSGDPIVRKKNYNWKILWYGNDGQDDERIHQEKSLIQIHQPEFNKQLYLNYEK